ncbi:MAG: hypothetical protein QNK37_27590 [Acidobacteriota bacterium]|nr:hypothetical protein [Acidobacteriota bacterium]
MTKYYDFTNEEEYPDKKIGTTWHYATFMLQGVQRYNGWSNTIELPYGENGDKSVWGRLVLTMTKENYYRSGESGPPPIIVGLKNKNRIQAPYWGKIGIAMAVQLFEYRPNPSAEEATAADSGTLESLNYDLGHSDNQILGFPIFKSVDQVRADGNADKDALVITGGTQSQKMDSRYLLEFEHRGATEINADLKFNMTLTMKGFAVRNDSEPILHRLGLWDSEYTWKIPVDPKIRAKGSN